MARLGIEGRALRLIERQAAQWELRRRLRDEGRRELVREYPHLAEGPWLSVSKTEGSLGVQVARVAAERLGWAVYDREIVETIARRAEVREKVLSSLDERVVGNLEDYFSRLAVRDYLGASVFARHLMAVLLTLGHHGKAVLVGRGAHFLLRPEFGLRVRVDAPLEVRVRRWAELHDATEREARSAVKRVDSQRRAWIRRCFHGEIDDPLRYDLVLNTERLSVDESAGLIVRAVRGRFETDGPTG